MKELTEHTNILSGHSSDPPPLSPIRPSPEMPRASETQLRAFQELARRIHNDRSTPRFEAALRKILSPIKKAPPQPTALPPTHNPES